MPNDVLAHAKALFRRRTGGELAVLAFDSLLDEDAPATDHRLRFDHPSMTIDVQVSAQEIASRLTGDIRPPGPHRVELELESGDVSFVEVVTRGTFSFNDVAHGVIRLRLIGSEGTATVHTDWFRV